MDILKTSTDWAKAEVFSSQFFIFFGLLFVLGTIGFWQWGKTEISQAFISPTLIAGIFLLVVGFGLFFSNKSRLTSFPAAYHQDASAFVETEIVRAERSMREYQTIVFMVMPVMIIIAALLIIFIDKPIWRAIGITTIALIAAIMLVDSHAKARVEAYHEALESAAKETNK